MISKEFEFSLGSLVMISLRNNVQYKFTENDLKKYFIDVEDINYIKQSGMFCLTTEQGRLQWFPDIKHCRNTWKLYVSNLNQKASQSTHF